MKRITPEIYVRNCKEALDFYQEAFGGEIKNVQTADGKEMFQGFEGKIIHAELHIGECALYFVDDLGQNKTESNISIVLEMDGEEEINRVYASLSKGGSVRYELQETFWGALHAVVTDRYGNTWGLNYTLR